MVGSGTSAMSGKPVNSGMSNPPPSANAGGNTLLAVSSVDGAGEVDAVLAASEIAAADRYLPRAAPCWSTMIIRTVRRPVLGDEGRRPAAGLPLLGGQQPVLAHEPVLADSP